MSDSQEPAQGDQVHDCPQALDWRTVSTLTMGTGAAIALFILKGYIPAVCAVIFIIAVVNCHNDKGQPMELDNPVTQDDLTEE